MPKASDVSPQDQGVPEEIRRHAPQPVLRPDGSLRQLARDVDRNVAENEAVRKSRDKWNTRMRNAKQEIERGYAEGESDCWAARLSSSKKRGLGYRIGKHST
jgi:hypothetical protein